MPTLEQVKEKVKNLDGCSRFIGKWEINELPKILWEDEDILRLSDGVYNQGLGIVVPMDKTLYSLFSSMERTSEYVFVNPNTGRCWSNTKFGEKWREIREKAGLSELKFHGLRHTVATRLIKENVPLPIVRDILAHSDIKTTMVYNQTDSLDMLHAIEVLNSYN